MLKATSCYGNLRANVRYVREFDGLRGLMAVWVLVGHWAVSTPFGFPRLPSNLGINYAVDVFIVLSGFAIATLLGRKKENYPQYILRRALRIFPVYWFYLAISIALAWVALDVWSSVDFGAKQAGRVEIATAAINNFWVNVLSHIPAIQSVVPSHLVPYGAYAFLGQAWSISLEWQFYLIAPFVIVALSAGTRDWRIAVLVVGTFLALAFLARFMPMGFIGSFSDKFAIGIATYYLLKWHEAHPGWLKPQRATAVSFLIVGLIILTRLPSSLPISIWVLAVGAVLSPNWGPLGLLSKFLTLGRIERAGKMSYSIYLSHMIPLTLTMLVLRNAGVEAGAIHSAILLVGTALGTFALSTISYKYLEEPFIKLGKKLSGSPPSPSTEIQFPRENSSPERELTSYR